MKIVTGQEPTELMDAPVHVDDPALGLHESGQSVACPEPGATPLFRYRRQRQDTGSRESKTTWVWDRSLQTWSEIIEKPVIDDLPRGNGAATAPAPAYIEAPPIIVEPVPDDAPRPAAPVRLRAIRSTLGRMFDILTLKVRFSPSSSSRSSATGLVKRGGSGSVPLEGRDAGTLAVTIVDRAEKQARRTLAEAEVQARELKDKAEKEAERSSSARIAETDQHCRGIVRVTEEHAAARAESIVARAEEKTKEQANIIISEAVKAAETVALTVISEAGEKTRIRAEIIVNQAIQRAEAGSRAIIAAAQERARAQAESLVAATEEACRHRLAEMEAQAGLLMPAPERQAREAPVAYHAQALEMPAREAPLAHPVQPPLQQVIDSARARAPQTAPIQPAPVAQKTVDLPAEGRVELIIKHPVNISRMQRMLNRLGRYPEIKIVDLSGSPGKGVAVKLYSHRLGRLPSLLEALPEVEKVAQLSAKASKICPGQRICPDLGSEAPVTRLLVTLVKYDELLDV